MNDFNQNHQEEDLLAPYQGLVEELKAPGARPSTPSPPETFKRDLRTQLLQEHDNQRLSSSEMVRLWRFAGTAVAGLVLIAAVVLFWTAVSNPSPAVGPGQDTVPLSTRTAVGTEPIQAPLAIQMGDVLRLVDYEVITTLDELTVALYWQKLAETEADYAVFFHLLDNGDNLTAQLDTLQVVAYDPDAPTNSSLTSEWPVGETIRQVYNLTLPPGVHSLDGVYQLTMGMYDLHTNERLPITTDPAHPVSDDGTAVWLADWTFDADTAVLDGTIIGSDLKLIGADFTENAAGIDLTLQWETIRAPVDDYTLFIHVLDENGVLLAQTDTPMQAEGEPTSQWLPDEVKSGTYPLSFGSLGNGRYQIVIGLEDGSGRRLEVASANIDSVVEEGTAVRVIEWQYDQADPNQPPAQGTMAVPGSRIFDLEIFKTPAGDLAEMPPNDMVEYLLDMNARNEVVTVNGQAWIQIGWRELESSAGGLGWIPVDHFNRILEFAGGANDAAPAPAGQGQVWLITAKQLARPSANDPITWEVTVGYTYESDSDVFLKLAYAHPDWESSPEGDRVPVDGLEQPLFLEPGLNEVTVTFGGNPGEIRQIAGTEQPVLVAQLGTIIEHADGRGQEIQLLSQETFVDYPFDLTQTGAINYFPGKADSDVLEILRLSPVPGTILSDTTHFEIEVAYTLSSQPEATLVVNMWPVGAGAANLGDYSQTISAGSSTETITFDFTPLDLATASDWILEVKLLPISASITESALASVSPHEDINIDAYHYQP